VNPASNSVPSVLALEVLNLKHSFQTDAGTLEVLKGLSFSLAAGRVLAIVGPSGSGKSTLLHLLGGLETPTSGELIWGGVGLAGASQEVLASRRALEVGFVFQHHYLLEDLTTLENVGLPGLIASMPNDARAIKLLQQVGLQDRANFFPRALSGFWQMNPRAVWTVPMPIWCLECWSSWHDSRIRRWWWSRMMRALSRG
jgi:lipoprotein-releasing system ATP-binding protein